MACPSTATTTAVNPGLRRNPRAYVAQVSGEAVEPASSSDGAPVLPDEHRVPEPAVGRASGGIWSYASVDEPVALELHVEAHLLLEVVAGRRRPPLSAVPGSVRKPTRRARGDLQFAPSDICASEITMRSISSTLTVSAGRS